MTALDLEQVIKIVCRAMGDFYYSYPIIRDLYTAFRGTLRAQDIIEIIKNEDLYWSDDELKQMLEILNTAPTKYVP